MPSIALAPVVSLDGSHIDEAWMDALIEIRIECQFQVPARCTLRFIDPGYVLLAKNSVSLGTTVKVGDPSNSSVTLVEAEVTSIGIEQPIGAQPELVVVAHDKSHRLGRSTNVKTFLNMTYSAIASDLASSAGLSPSTTDTALTFDHLMQVDSDLGLLTELARRVGYDWWVEAGTLKFKPPSVGSAVDLSLGDDLQSFSARASGHHPDAVVINGWDRSTQEAVTSTTESATDKASVVSTSSLAGLVSRPVSAFGKGSVQSSILSPRNQEEVDQLSKAVFTHAISCSVRAEGVAFGTGNLKLGSTARVSHAGPLNGDYPVTRVEHLFRPRSGFTTRFASGDRWPSSLVDTLVGSGPRRPATFHPGLAVGVVTNVKDPDKHGRVKMKFPGLSNQAESDWARVVAIGGGASRGTAFLPEVNDEVLVAFEGGDPRQPVVIGGLYSSKRSIPASNVDDDTGQVQSRGMTSRLGHFIGMLDGSELANQAIVLSLAKSADGQSNNLHLGQDKLSITLAEGIPIEIKAGASSFQFDKEGNLTISAPKVSITAEEQFTVTAGQISLAGSEQAGLTSEGQVSVEGATVSITSEGPLSASGEPISLN